VNELVRSYGRGLTALFVGLVVAWIVGLILVPQIRMIERAFIYEDRGGETAMLALEIDRLYTDKFKLEQRLLAAAPAAADTSLPSPSLTPSPSPSPSPGLTPSPGGGGGTAMTAAERAEIEVQIAGMERQIAVLEAREDTSSGEAGMKESYSLENFTSMSAIHFEIFVMTLLYALCVTVLSFLVCYPVAYAAATMESEERLTLLMVALVVPYAINELLRIFSWVMILEKQGILNWVLDALGFISMDAGEGFRFVASNGAVFTVMIYAYILFMVFPIYNTIDTLDKNQIEAARDLGASVWKIHTRVVIPHAKPGIAVGSIMTFMLSAGSIAAPEIVGRGLHPDWFSQLIYRRFFEADSWNQGSAYSVALLVACVAFILVNMAIFKVGIRDIAK
jgi:spermidine/putrescine transport system permease protein